MDFPVPRDFDIALFFERLYLLLNDSTKRCILRWNHDGKRFVIWNDQRFQVEICPLLFQLCNWSNFLQTLHGCKFRRTNFLEFSHEVFSLRRLQTMTREERHELFRSELGIKQTRLTHRLPMETWEDWLGPEVFQTASGSSSQENVPKQRCRKNSNPQKYEGEDAIVNVETLSSEESSGELPRSTPPTDRDGSTRDSEPPLGSDEETIMVDYRHPPSHRSAEIGGEESLQHESDNAGDEESVQQESDNAGDEESVQHESDNAGDEESLQHESDNAGDEQRENEEDSNEDDNASDGDAASETGRHEGSSDDGSEEEAMDPDDEEPNEGPNSNNNSDEDDSDDGDTSDSEKANDGSASEEDERPQAENSDSDGPSPVKIRRPRKPPTPTKYTRRSLLHEPEPSTSAAAYENCTYVSETIVRPRDPEAGASGGSDTKVVLKLFKKFNVQNAENVENVENDDNREDAPRAEKRKKHKRKR